MMDITEFAKVMGLLAASYPRFEMTEATIEAYYQILGDLDIDLVKAAASDLVGSDSPWFPTAGQIRAAAFRMVEEQRGDPTAGEAWGEVMATVGTVGYVGVPEFSDPLVKQSVDAIGGWLLLCQSHTDAMAANRARFIQAYETLQERARHQERMLPQVREVVKRLAVGGSRPQLGAGDD
jgi:hypothetical protein